MKPFRRVCGCSRERPCHSAAYLFDRSKWTELREHLERSIELVAVRSPKPTAIDGTGALYARDARSFATIGDLVKARRSPPGLAKARER